VTLHRQPLGSHVAQVIRGRAAVDRRLPVDDAAAGGRVLRQHDGDPGHVVSVVADGQRLREWKMWRVSTCATC